MVTTDRQKRKREKRRNEIIDAAEGLFYSKGFDKVSMDEIAQEIELSKGTLYFYFKSKDSLFFAIVFRRWADFGESITKKVSHGKTGFEKIQIMIKSLIEYAQENADYNDMFTTFWPQLYQRIDEQDMQTMKEISVEYMPRIHKAVMQGIEDGSVRNDLEPGLLGMYVELITFYVISPNPSFKSSFEVHGISYDTYVEMLPKFLCPAVARHPAKECDGQDQ